MLLYKNKFRFYFLFNKIFKKILQYKDLNRKTKKINILNKIIINFNIISEKNLSFFYGLLDIYFFFKSFSKKICIKKLIHGNLKLFFKNASLKNSYFCNFQSILKKKKIYLFLNFFFFLFTLKKKNFNLQLTSNTLNFKSLKLLTLVFYNLFGKIKINLNNNSKNNYNFFLFNFLISIFK